MGVILSQISRLYNGAVDTIKTILESLNNALNSLLESLKAFFNYTRTEDVLMEIAGEAEVKHGDTTANIKHGTVTVSQTYLFHFPTTFLIFL